MTKFEWNSKGESIARWFGKVLAVVGRTSAGHAYADVSYQGQLFKLMPVRMFRYFNNEGLVLGSDRKRAIAWAEKVGAGLYAFDETVTNASARAQRAKVKDPAFSSEDWTVITRESTIDPVTMVVTSMNSESHKYFQVIVSMHLEFDAMWIPSAKSHCVKFEYDDGGWPTPEDAQRHAEEIGQYFLSFAQLALS